MPLRFGWRRVRRAHLTATDTYLRVRRVLSSLSRSTGILDRVIRRTFVSDERQRRFSDDGAVTLALFTPERAAQLRDEMLSLSSGSRSGWHSSNESTDHAYRQRVHVALADLFSEALAGVLDDYRLFNTSILVKWPGPDGAMGTHQDWTFVDEQRFRSVSVWCPLVDVDSRNGALEVLPGSHKVLTHERCSPSLPESYRDPLAGLGDGDLDPWPVAAGTAIVLDHAVAHRSPPNLADQPRVVIAGAFAPSEAMLRHHFREPSGRVWAFDIPDTAWFQAFDIGQRPRDVPTRGESPFAAGELTSAELLDRCGRSDAGRADDPGPTPSPSPPSTPRVGSRFASLWRSRNRGRGPAASPAKVVAPRPMTFRGNALETQFQEQGYLVVDLLDPGACAELRDAYDSLEHGNQWDGEFARGFHTSMYDDRAEYRREVFSAIEDAMVPAFEELLADHRICLANFTAKLPDGEPVPGHLDWTFVDEAGASSATVWCAIEDIAEEQGALTVVPGSHHKVDFIRPVNFRDYDRHAAVAGGDQVAVPIRAGQAIVMDNRTVHGSLANRTARTRVAAAAVVAPQAVALHHYWIDGDDDLIRLEIDPAFFIDYEIGKDPTTSKGVLGRSVVRGAEFA